MAPQKRKSPKGRGKGKRKQPGFASRGAVAVGSLGLRGGAALGGLGLRGFQPADQLLRQVLYGHMFVGMGAHGPKKFQWVQEP